MAIKKYKPTSAGRRGMTVSAFTEVTAKEPYKPLTQALQKHSGRNVHGHLTVRHRGGGSRRLYRIIDFKRNKFGVVGTVETIEYDPNRSARIALIVYTDGERRYMLAPDGLRVGQSIQSGSDAPVRPGNAMPLRNVPPGTDIHNIELNPGRGGQLVRSAGVAAQLVARAGEYGQIRMPSGEVRLISLDCIATLGRVGNVDHENVVIGKAGRNRLKGWRPTVRGSVMNPRDHPHGGGEGRAPIGGQPQTPWGKPALGYRTRHNKRTDPLIVRKRSKGRKS